MAIILTNEISVGAQASGIAGGSGMSHVYPSTAWDSRTAGLQLNDARKQAGNAFLETRGAVHLLWVTSGRNPPVFI
jgi:hypothetical protein